MKQSIKFIAVAFAIIGFSATSYAQGTATSAATDANATIVAPIGISVGSDMGFGAVVRDADGGTVVLSSAGVRTANGVSFSVGTPGTIGASSFDVTGESNYTYAITLPSTDVTLTDAVSSETMAVNAFSSSLGATGTLDVAGEQTLLVGATLNVGALQEPGLYEGTYTVTVAYN